MKTVVTVLGFRGKSYSGIVDTPNDDSLGHFDLRGPENSTLSIEVRSTEIGHHLVELQIIYRPEGDKEPLSFWFEDLETGKERRYRGPAFAIPKWRFASWPWEALTVTKLED